MMKLYIMVAMTIATSDSSWVPALPMDRQPHQLEPRLRDAYQQIEGALWQLGKTQQYGGAQQKLGEALQSLGEALQQAPFQCRATTILQTRWEKGLPRRSVNPTLEEPLGIRKTRETFRPSTGGMYGRVSERTDDEGTYAYGPAIVGMFKYTHPHQIGTGGTGFAEPAIDYN